MEALENNPGVKLTQKHIENYENNKYQHRCFGYKMQGGNYSTLHCWSSMWLAALHLKKLLIKKKFINSIYKAKRIFQYEENNQAALALENIGNKEINCKK